MPQKNIESQTSLFAEEPSPAAAGPEELTAAQRALSPGAAVATQSLWTFIDGSRSYGKENAALNLARALRASGQLSLVEPLGHSKQPLLEAWASVTSDENVALSLDGLKELARWAKEDGLDVWGEKIKSPDLGRHSRRHDGPAGLFRSVMAAFDGGSELLSKGETAKKIAWVIENAPLAQVKAWSPRFNHTENAGILEWAVGESLPDEPALALLDRGFSLNGAKRVTGGLLAKGLQSPALWGRFLAEGGDPRQKVESRRDGEGLIPLWKHLSERNSQSGPAQEVSALAKAWAEANVRDELLQDIDKKYWAGFSTQHNEIGKYMKADKNWPNKRDPQGRTPMMHLVLKNVNEAKTFIDIKKAEEGILAKDHEGRTLWAYMLAQGKAMNGDVARWLAKTIPAEVDAKGRGLFAQAMSAERQNSSQSTMSLKGGIVDAVKDPLVWWGATAERQDEMADHFLKDAYWGGKKEHNPARLITLAWGATRAAGVEGLSPKLLGALALIQLLSPDQMSVLENGYGEKKEEWATGSGKEWAMKMIEKGAQWPSPDGMEETLLARIEFQGTARLEEPMALAEAHELRRTIAPAAAPGVAAKPEKSAAPSRRL